MKPFIRTKFLTKNVKRAELKELEEAIEGGEVDEQIIPYLRYINRIDGLCTIGSCWGHRGEKKKPMSEGIGYVLVRPNKKIFMQLYKTNKLKELAKYLKEICIVEYSLYSIRLNSKRKRTHESIDICFDFHTNKWRKSLEKIIEVLEEAGE